MKGLSTTTAIPDAKACEDEKGSAIVSERSAPAEKDTPFLAIFYTKPNREQARLLKSAALYILLLVFLRSTSNAVKSAFKSSDDVSIKSYETGLAGQGWKFGDDQLVDREKLDRILLRWSRQEDAASETIGAKHHHEDKKHHRCDKHGKHSHSIGPKEAEALFLTVPKNESLAAANKRYTAYSHMAGTGEDLVSAINLKAEYEKLLNIPYSAPYDKIWPAGSRENQAAIRGLGQKDKPEVWLDTYYPLMNKPVSRSLEILSPINNGAIEWSAKLREDIVEGDPGSIMRDEVPTFHGLSVSGNVTGKIVFAGYGSKRDFEALEAKGFDLRKEPTIVLVKYGKVFRGLKVKAAQEAGAIGCLIYSDPGDDGEKTIKNGYKPYPEGPARQPSSVQRGSVQFLSSYPGDPSTPGYPAYENATRVPGGNFPSIPSLPISYEDALPLLRTLEGKGQLAREVGDDWEGGLTDQTEYWTGPSEKEIRFINQVDTKETKIWSVFAYIPGHIKDEVVVVGNHRDAWVLGGADPSSGTATVYEIMRGISKLRASGWKPLRSILVASWDAEEYGLISSTEFCEDFGDWLQANVVAYLNIDVSVAGNNFHGSASPSLANLLRDAALQIEHPHSANRTLWDMDDGGDWADYNTRVKGLPTTFESELQAGASSSTGVKALGSGSDYTAFLQRYGIASTDMGYGGGPNDPPYHYHSIYDSHTWQSMYGDPGFHKHVAATKMLGLMTLRVADSLLIPLNLTQYGQDLSQYLVKVKAISQELDYALDFSDLEDAVSRVLNATSTLDHRAASLTKELAKLTRSGPGHRFWTSNKKAIAKILLEIRAINKKRRSFESGFLSKEGIKDREWYRHKGTAPGKWLGYGSTTFPGLTEAMTIDHDAVAAQGEAQELADLLNGMATKLRK